MLTPEFLAASMIALGLASIRKGTFVRNRGADEAGRSAPPRQGRRRRARTLGTPQERSAGRR